MIVVTRSSRDGRAAPCPPSVLWRARAMLSVLLMLPPSLEQDLPILRPPDDMLGAPAHAPDPPGVQAAWLGSAMLLNESEYVFVDDSTRQAYVAVASSQTRSLIDAAPTLPSTIRLIGRSSSGRIVAADDHRDSLGAITAAGMEWIAEYDGRSWQPVCALADGTVLVRPGLRPNFGAFQSAGSAIHRDTVRYSAMDRHEAVRPITTAPGAETTWLPTSDVGWRTLHPMSVIFGHNTHVACSSKYFVFAQTDSAVVKLFNHQGDLTLQFPMPGRRRSVSPLQIESQKTIAMQAANRSNRLTRRRLEHIASGTGIEITLPNLLPAHMIDVPANDVAPSVDRLFVDASDRVWLRLLPMPDDEIVHWHIWSIDRQETSFLFETSRRLDVVDAYDANVLLRTANVTGHDVLLVSPMNLKHEPDQPPALSLGHASESTPIRSTKGEAP